MLPPEFINHIAASKNQEELFYRSRFAEAQIAIRNLETEMRSLKIQNLSMEERAKTLERKLIQAGRQELEFLHSAKLVLNENKSLRLECESVKNQLLLAQTEFQRKLNEQIQTFENRTEELEAQRIQDIRDWEKFTTKEK
jgi:phosphoenolpyruvate-protein kinase (PTS system EI component)